MKRPDAARHPAVAAVNEPQARPSHPRREKSGDVSSGTLALGFAARLGAAAAALVVFPASAGFIGGGGGGFGFAGAAFGAPLGGVF